MPPRVEPGFAIILLVLDVLVPLSGVWLLRFLHRRAHREVWDGLQEDSIEAEVVAFEREDEPIEGPAVDFPVLEYEVDGHRHRVLAPLGRFPPRDAIGDRVRIHLRHDDPERFTDSRDLKVSREAYVLLILPVWITLGCWLMTAAMLGY